MIRKIIHIDEKKCNGCGLCASVCHEGAIGMVNGKARLLQDDYCDGLGDCLPTCPTGAIRFVEREAAAYDEAAVQAVKAAPTTLENRNDTVTNEAALPCGSGASSPAFTPRAGCPGSQSRTIERSSAPPPSRTDIGGSELRQWPIQIKLAPMNAPYFNGAHLLIAADCTAYAYGSFHADFIRGKVVLIGCPKLDAGNYADKLTEIIRQNEVKSLTIVRMEVPCCTGIEQAAVTALKNSGKFIPWQVVVISTDGHILHS